MELPEHPSEITLADPERMNIFLTSKTVKNLHVGERKQSVLQRPCLGETGPKDT